MNTYKVIIDGGTIREFHYGCIIADSFEKAAEICIKLKIKRGGGLGLFIYPTVSEKVKKFECVISLEVHLLHTGGEA